MAQINGIKDNSTIDTNHFPQNNHESTPKNTSISQKTYIRMNPNADLGNIPS